MTGRLDLFTAAPAEMKAWFEMSLKIAPKLEHSLLELVKIRASQINGCANCLNMHTADARKAGESEQRIYLLSAWHEAPCYTPRERAALAWTDAMTLVSTARAPQAIYEELAFEFTQEEQVQLTLMINVINGWNRLAVGFDLFYDAKPVVAAA
ncbi:carboxymuconolactone decarboxylase family protein [Sphingomonas kyeonggiensis]|uniref:AhpD family alkylhydroperoxidase n=1 Tax=Sphingomonas kyeonggiensis TaxID=1268553 RepID=A0A7W6NV72_9SPHN|nr:carboxymuconolactone decarboxylase family protein [Sphingomonas kyeonggiensis]MBB4097147.1 AhpD family alkylhydroperoxidase [Sphingomonas kyeonggiensis]